MEGAIIWNDREILWEDSIEGIGEYKLIHVAISTRSPYTFGTLQQIGHLEQCRPRDRDLERVHLLESSKWNDVYGRLLLNWQKWRRKNGRSIRRREGKRLRDG